VEREGDGGVLERDELHGIAVLGLRRLARDQPPDGGDLLAHVEVKVAGSRIFQSFSHVPVAIERMDRVAEAQSLHLLFVHDGSRREVEKKPPPSVPFPPHTRRASRQERGEESTRDTDSALRTHDPDVSQT
jgi:hypothetical protein